MRWTRKGYGPTRLSRMDRPAIRGGSHPQALIVCVALVLTAVFASTAHAATGASTVQTAPAATAATVSAERNPVVSGPIQGGLHNRPWFAASYNVADYGYSEQEYFYSGTATAYGTDEPPAPYETRMLVYRPTDPKKFSGNVVVEWNNVTAQMDMPVDFVWLHDQIMASGDAYVEISAQQAGVCGAGLTGGSIISSSAGLSPAVCTPLSLKGYDAVRYGPLVHPGDGYSFDIFSQGAQAIRHPKGISPLGTLPVQRVIAIGESQSAMELDDYVLNGADRAAKVFDGFVIDADAHNPLPATYRIPTLRIWSEESAQPGTSNTAPNNVTWSVAGAAHTDYWMLQQSTAALTASHLSLPPVSRQQQAANEETESNYGQEGPSASATCGGDTEFPRRYVVDAALTDLEQWVKTGTPAPSAPPFEFSDIGQVAQQLPPPPPIPGFPTGDNAGGLVTSPLALNRDSNGNALGGLRLPVVSVPVASYNGSACVLLGTSTPLLPTELQQLYPTHADYVGKMVTATKAAVKARYLTVSDGVDLLQHACDSAIPSWGITPSDDQPPVCRQLPHMLTAASGSA